MDSETTMQSYINPLPLFIALLQYNNLWIYTYLISIRSKGNQTSPIHICFSVYRIISYSKLVFINSSILLCHVCKVRVIKTVKWYNYLKQNSVRLIKKVKKKISLSNILTFFYMMMVILKKHKYLIYHTQHVSGISLVMYNQNLKIGMFKGS